MTISRIYDEAVASAQSALVEFFVLTLPPALAEKFPELAVVRIANSLNPLGQPFVWQGNTYLPIPVKAEGFEVTTEGALPRPTLTFSNVDALMTGIVTSTDDLVGTTVKRLRTYERFLDAVNFPDGNPDANPNYALPTERYIVEKKIAENSTVVSFELASAMDLNGVKLPLRQINPNVCTWRYRGDGCGYAGPPVADADDHPLSAVLSAAEKLAADQCSLTQKGCKLRFPGPYDDLPFGGFPGAVLDNY